MNTIIPQAPEVPDPAQLDLFTAGPGDEGTVYYSTGPDKESRPEPDPAIRSPTTPETGKVLTEAQKLLASSLYRKSRELVIKSINQKDLAR